MTCNITAAKSNNEQVGEIREETFLLPEPAALPRRARLPCARLKEAEFSQCYDLGTISDFRVPRVDAKNYSGMMSGKPVSIKTQLEMIKISPAFRFLLGHRENREL